MGKIIGHIKKYSWRYVFVLGFVVGLLFCLRAEIRNFSFDPNTGHLDVEMREQNDIEYFNSVWEDSDRLKIHLLLLAEKGVYRADDPSSPVKKSRFCSRRKFGGQVQGRCDSAERPS